MNEDLRVDVARSLESANRAYMLYGFAMQVFQANAQRGDFEAAEDEREKMHVLLDGYIDDFMVANKRVMVG